MSDTFAMRSFGSLAAAVAVASALGCAGVPAVDAASGAIEASALRDRLARVAPGQRGEEVRTILGTGANPLRLARFATPGGEPVRVEFYAVAARASEACAEAVVIDEPVVFVADVVTALGWDAVEAGWRGWGGTLEALRAARSVPDCTAES